MKLSSYLLFAIILLTIGCDQDPVIEPVETEIAINRSFPSADQRLWTHFQTFEFEARQRGLTFDLIDLNI